MRIAYGAGPPGRFKLKRSPSHQSTESAAASRPGEGWKAWTLPVPCRCGQISIAPACFTSCSEIAFVSFDLNTKFALCCSIDSQPQRISGRALRAEKARRPVPPERYVCKTWSRIRTLKPLASLRHSPLSVWVRLLVGCMPFRVFSKQCLATAEWPSYWSITSIPITKA